MFNNKKFRIEWAVHKFVLLVYLCAPRRRLSPRPASRAWNGHTHAHIFNSSPIPIPDTFQKTHPSQTPFLCDTNVHTGALGPGANFALGISTRHEPPAGESPERQVRGSAQGELSAEKISSDSSLMFLSFCRMQAKKTLLISPQLGMTAAQVLIGVVSGDAARKRRCIFSPLAACRLIEAGESTLVRSLVQRGLGHELYSAFAEVLESSTP